MPSAWAGRRNAGRARAHVLPPRTPNQFRRNTASRRRSLGTSLDARFEQRAQPAQLLVTQVLVGNEMRHQQLGRALEYFVDQPAQRIATGGVALDQRMVAVRPAFAGMRHIAFLLEGAEHGEDSRV